MMPASNRGVGGDLAFPDVCKTPAGPVVVPIPYPNLGLNVLAATFSPNVFWSFVPALNQTSMIAMTHGDEPGVLGGVVSGIIMGTAYVTMGNPIVFVNFVPAKNLLSMTSGNLFNAPLGFTLIPSLTNVLLTAAGVTNDEVPALGFARPVATDAVHRLGERLERGSVTAAIDERGVAWIRLPFFARTASQDVWNALETLGPTRVRAVVLDLRDNPGGDLGAAIDLADDFLPLDTEIVRLESIDGDVVVHAARRSTTYVWPLAICVNAATASAAEVVAASLRARGRARVFGAPTAGKLTVQRVFGDSDANHYGTVGVVAVEGHVTGPVVPDDAVDPNDDEALSLHASSVFTTDFGATS